MLHTSFSRDDQPFDQPGPRGAVLQGVDQLDLEWMKMQATPSCPRASSIWSERDARALERVLHIAV